MLDDGVAVHAEAVGVVGGGELDGGVDGVEDARPRAAAEAPPVVQQRRRLRRYPSPHPSTYRFGYLQDNPHIQIVIENWKIGSIALKDHKNWSCVT